MAKLLFFPAEIGLAHIVRTLAVAEACRAKGHQVAIAVPKRKRHHIPKNIRVIEVEPLSDADSIEIVNDHFNRRYFEHLVSVDKAVIEAERPQLVIVDFRFSALIASAACGTAAVLLTNSTALTVEHDWPSFGPTIISRKITPLFTKQVHHVINTRLTRLFHDSLESFEHPRQVSRWLRSLPTLLPEPFAYMPPTKPRPNLHYIGPIQWRGLRVTAPKWLDQLDGDFPTVYLSFGGTGFSGSQLIAIAQQLLADDFQVIVAVGVLVSPEAFPKHKRLFVSEYINVRTIAQSVQVVVCHGGYGTLSQAIEFGKPVVMVPFNPDQVIHSLRFQEMGLGICLFRMTPVRVKELVQMEWERFSAVGKSVTANEVAKAVKKILNDDTYQRRAEQLQPLFDSTESTKRAVEVLENLLPANV